MEIPSSSHHLHKWTGIYAPLLLLAYFAEMTYCPSKVQLYLCSGFTVTRTSIHQHPPPLHWIILISIQFTLISPFLKKNYLILILYYPSTISHISAPFYKSNILRVVLTGSLHLTSNSVFPKNVSCMHVSKWYILIESNNLLRNFKREQILSHLTLLPQFPSLEATTQVF